MTSGFFPSFLHHGEPQRVRIARGAEGDACGYDDGLARYGDAVAGCYGGCFIDHLAEARDIRRMHGVNAEGQRHAPRRFDFRGQA